MDRALTADIIEWEVRNWSRALEFWEPHLPTSDGIRALTLGERNGGLSLWLALKKFAVTCTDVSGVTDFAREIHRRHDVVDTINYDEADATALPYADGTFDVVAFKSMLGALSTKERQKAAVQEMRRVLKPGGIVLMAENLAGSPLHQALRRRFVSWSSYWRYLDSHADRDLFSEFSEFREDTHGMFALFGRSETQRDLLARVDSLLSPVFPRETHTIWFALMRK